jgi:hypothetical protein
MCMCTCIRDALVLRVRAASALEGERAEQDQSLAAARVWSGEPNVDYC